MIRNLKTLGLALVAVFALSAIAANAASAQDLLTSPEASTILTGENEEVGKFRSEPGAAPIECKHSFYKGVMSAKSVGEITVHPTYPDTAVKDCHFGEATATVNTNGCDYVLTGTTDANKDATVNLECTSGSSIVVTVTGICTLTFGTQTGLKGVHYTNGANDVTVKATVTGVHFTKSTPGNFCNLVPCHKVGENVNTCDSGVLEEAVTVKGFKTGTASQNATTHDWTMTEGSQVDLTTS